MTIPYVVVEKHEGLANCLKHSMSDLNQVLQ